MNRLSPNAAAPALALLPDGTAQMTPETRWYLAQTHPNAEHKASHHLVRQGFAIYLPRYLKKRRHARRLDQVAAPLFPRYLFIGIDLTAQRWHSIKSTVGITRLVTQADLPVPVPHGIIEGLLQREDDQGFIRLDVRNPFSPGDRVRVRDGAFCDCLGLFEEISGSERSAILLELLGRKVRVVLDTAFIEAA